MMYTHSKSLLTVLSINEDLLIQIFDNQSSERRWKCWLCISHRQAIAQWWHWIKITHNKIHYSALSLQPVLPLLYLSRSLTLSLSLYEIYMYLYIPLWITEVRVYQPETDSAQILIYLKRMLSGVLSK